MNEVNRTLYIPLYGKSLVSRKGLFLSDKQAEQIWETEQFPLTGKSASKWVAYYVGIRAAVFDDWLRQKMTELPDAVVVHIGCGLDSRVLRVGTGGHPWYDVDFPEVIRERERFFEETAEYQMIGGDIREDNWLDTISRRTTAIVVMEGVSMYLTLQELHGLVQMLTGHFENVYLLMDCYTEFAAKMSRYKNPVNDVGVTKVYGLDCPEELNQSGFRFLREHEMTPERYINELQGPERLIFKNLYAGPTAQKLYRLYEFRSE